MTTDEVLNVAHQSYQSGKTDQAEAICRKVLQHLPDQPVALNLLGTLLAGRRRFDESIELFGRLAALRPDLPDAHANLALTLHQAGQLDQAEAACRRALGISPKHFGAQVTLGNVLQDKAAQRNDMATLDAAITVLRQVVALRPDWGYSHFNLANALSNRGRPEEALAAYRKAALILPADPGVQLNLGIALRELGELPEAVAAYEQALKLNPGEWRALSNLGRLLEDAGKWEQAIDCFQRTIALHGYLPEVRKNLAHVFLSAGRDDQAADAYLEIVNRWPGDADAFWNLCRLGIAKHIECPRDFAYRGDRVVLLHCPADVRRRLDDLALHGGHDADRWLTAQIAARHPPDVLHRLLARWLENLRNEAGMSGTTATVWLPDPPLDFAAVVRELAGPDLIEITADDPAPIRAQLAALQSPIPNTADQFWAVVSIRNGGLELLPHWLDHYQRLGCHRLLIGLFDDLQPAAMAEIERCKAQWTFETFPQRWEGEGYEAQYLQRRSACRKAGAVPATWIINTDLDELHQFPAPLAEIAQAADDDVSAFYGRFADRVAADGSFPAVTATPSLWEQFPIECDISGRICQATTQKVMLSRYSVHVNPCHHDAANAARVPPPLGKASDYKVAHFKWHGGLPSRLRWGLEQPNASAVWKRETRRLLAWLDHNGGRINLDDPTIEAHRSI